VNIYEELGKFKLKICGNVFSLKKVPLGGAQEGILSKADFEF
jgi:hypothetical protein